MGWCREQQKIMHHNPLFILLLVAAIVTLVISIHGDSKRSN
jgi:hypothetical protein